MIAYLHVRKGKEIPAVIVIHENADLATLKTLHAELLKVLLPLPPMLYLHKAELLKTGRCYQCFRIRLRSHCERFLGGCCVSETNPQTTGKVNVQVFAEYATNQVVQRS